MKENLLTPLQSLRDQKEQKTEELKRSHEAGDQDNFDAIEKEIEKLDEDIAAELRQEKLNNITGKRNQSTLYSPPVIKRGGKATAEDWDKTFLAWALAGSHKGRKDTEDDWKRSADRCEFDIAMPEWSVRTQSSDVANKGEEFVEAGIIKGFVEARKAYGGLLSVANVVSLDKKITHRYPTSNDTDNVATTQSSQNTNIEQADIDTDEIEVPLETYVTADFPISFQLLRDSKNDIAAWVGRALTRRIMKLVNVDLTAELASSTTQGYTGTSNALDHIDLGELYFSVDSEYAEGPSSVFMGNKNTKKHLWLQFADPNEGPVWGDALNIAPVSNIMGQRYITNYECDDMLLGTPRKPLFFGDFSHFQVHTVGPTPTLMRVDELYARSLSVGFFMYWEVGGVLLDAGTHPIKHLSTGLASGA